MQRPLTTFLSQTVSTQNPEYDLEVQIDSNTKKLMRKKYVKNQCCALF